jgi:hypothetical protein
MAPAPLPRNRLRHSLVTIRRRERDEHPPPIAVPRTSVEREVRAEARPRQGAAPEREKHDLAASPNARRRYGTSRTICASPAPTIEDPIGPAQQP